MNCKLNFSVSVTCDINVGKSAHVINMLHYSDTIYTRDDMTMNYVHEKLAGYAKLSVYNHNLLK